MNSPRAPVLWIALTIAALCPRARGDDPSSQHLEFFERSIRPVLIEHCYKCHSEQTKRPKGSLRLDSRNAILKGGDNGPALVPGKPDKSRLLEAIEYRNVDLQMPPKGKLPNAVIADLAKWIRLGAPWPKEKPTQVVAGKYEFDLHKRKREHWAWRALHDPAIPKVENRRWPVNSLDRFILAGMEAKQLKPAPAAEPRTVLRRLYFDIIGLPPTPDEVAAFEKSASVDVQLAIESTVDRLLASPRFGERWGRHWLDLVRYGESRGHEFDYVNPNAYQYRDYVIRAFNGDVPYDRFVVEHIAGDLLEKPRLYPKQKFNESILGTGFWHLGEQVHSPVDICQDKTDRFDNMLDVFSKTFLGLTVSCARCHDHKFDAISTKDYYSLAGFLESSSYRLVRFDTMEEERQFAEELQEMRERGRARLQKVLAESCRPAAARLADYLTAARTATSAVFSGDYRRLEQIANERQLVPAILARWVRHLAGPARNADQPFHRWWKVCRERDGKLPDGKPSSDATTSAISEVIVDYANPGDDGWLPDGYAFGLGPVRAGDLLGLDRSSLRFAERTAAMSDPAFARLRLAPGSENDPGALGGQARAGRTIRTPTFEVKSGRIHYLVKGAGRAYAAVEAHVMINGPLHGQLVRPIKTESFQWITHDLTPYQGRRAHVEFTPADGADLAIATVVQGEQPPPLPHGSSVLQGEPKTIEELARSYQATLEDIIKRLDSGEPLAGKRVRWSNWLLSNADLFGASARIDNAAKDLGNEHTRLRRGREFPSRLALAMRDGNGVNERVFIRGTYKAPGEPAPRRLLEALAGSEPLAIQRGSGRLELARQIVDPRIDPFLPRVMANRVWHYLFGKGIVASVDNFGVLGERPTHPELLDHLATQFIKDGWSIKKLIRRIATSRAYQMSIREDAQATKLDPENRLWQHRRLRRLEGEAIRDAMLAVSGRLDLRMYGPSVPVHLTEFQEGRGRPASGPLDGDGRRSIYLAVRRNFLSSFLLAFDAPIPFSTVGRRTVSNVPAQALILLNDPFVHQQAETWAKRVLAQPGTAQERIAAMYRSAFSRGPTVDESAACREFLSTRQAGISEVAAWTALAHVLYNAKEFIYLE